MSTALLRTSDPHNALQGSKALKPPEHCQRFKFLGPKQTYGIRNSGGETQKSMFSTILSWYPTFDSHSKFQIH